MRITVSAKLVLCGVVVWGFACQRTSAGSDSGGNSSSGGKSATPVGGAEPASSGGASKGGITASKDGSAAGGTTASRGGTTTGNSGGNTTSSGGNTTGTAGGATTSAGGNTASAGSATGGTSASGGSTSAGGATTSLGGTSGTVSTASLCSNGVQDPGETGIDCGGTCPACPLVYKINPPNQCQNQYFYSNCKSGDATTQCGGVCQPRNACENAPGKDGKVEGFACSRYMLFSPAMLQAAKDDGAQNGWDASAPPFLYAVVGHDTNTGGIDQGMTGNQPCCECYQLIFDQPFNEGGSQSNQAPAPKPLIVQTFNIGATTDSFDIYMGAGGFGAFNGCMDVTIKSSAGFALYDAYPADGQPGNGGVKFRSYDECKTSDQKITTADAISSAACQNKIAGFCNQVKSSKSADLASTTINSCIESNQVGTLYHQNWAVYAKRVVCPDNLTRVTGCKLAAETGLAKVDPKVTTVDQAKAAGFLSGYHTTTMQDCCKPACAWTEKVAGNEGMKKADPQFTNFYTCDPNDQPLTE